MIAPPEGCAGGFRGIIWSTENQATEESTKMSEPEQRYESPLVSERGVTTIKDTVVSTIAGMAAREVGGVHMGGSASRTTGGLLENITGSESQTRGVSAQVGRTEVAIDLKMGIEYGRDILQTVEEVRRRIIDRVESMTGLKVVECNATISDIVFPEGRGVEDGRRRELGPGYEEYEARPEARRTEEYSTVSQEREAEDSAAAYVTTRETSSTEEETRRETRDTEEARVEPQEGDETAELRFEDDEAYRESYRDRRNEER